MLTERILFILFIVFVLIMLIGLIGGIIDENPKGKEVYMNIENLQKVMKEFERKYVKGWIAVKFDNASFEEGAFMWNINSESAWPPIAHDAEYHFESLADGIAYIKNIVED